MKRRRYARERERTSTFSTTITLVKRLRVSRVSPISVGLTVPSQFRVTGVDDEVGVDEDTVEPSFRTVLVVALGPKTILHGPSREVY